VISLLEIRASGESCLCDFTFDFYWQHQGSRLDPDQAVSGISYRKMVEALKIGENVHIMGDAGSRLGSSLGVDLIKMGGQGGPVKKTGNIFVDGDAGSRMGISMLRGAIYVAGRVDPPLGNVIEVETDRTGYRKFISITEAVECGLSVLEPNRLEKAGLLVCDEVLRDTLGARNSADKIIRVQGDVGMSTGILMRSGLIDVSGNAGRNTGVLMSGGRLVIKGSTDDFTGAEMRAGEIFIGGNAGSFACAKMRGGRIYAREGKPLAPARAHVLRPEEQAAVAKALGTGPFFAMMYRRLGL
jgi:formylmethanofuran dehydrogenase subunit C